MVVINVAALRLQVDGEEHVNHKNGDEKQVALHFEGTMLKIIYSGCKSTRPLQWKYNKIKLIPSETTSGFGCDVLQSDGLMLRYKVRPDKREDIQRLLKSPIQTSSSSSSSGKTKENINRQTPSTGSTSSSQHPQRRANMTSKPKAVLQYQLPISVVKSASVSRDGYSSSSGGMGTYLNRNQARDVLTSPLVDRQHQDSDESDYARAIKASLETSGGLDLRDTDDHHRQSLEQSHTDRQQARNSADTSRDLNNVKGALFSDHDNGPSAASAVAASSSSSGGRRVSGGTMSSKYSQPTIPDRPQITVLPGLPPSASGGSSSKKTLHKLDNDAFWKCGNQPLQIKELALTYGRKTGSNRSYVGKPLSSIVGNSMHNYYDRGMAHRVAGAFGAISMAPSRNMYNNNSKNNGSSKAEELAEKEARNVARAIADSIESSGGLDLRDTDDHRPGSSGSGGKSLFGTNFQRSSSSSGRGAFEGMRNLGNTCYLSSVLQAMYCLEGFGGDIRSAFWSTLAQQATAIPAPSSSSSSALSSSSSSSALRPSVPAASGRPPLQVQSRASLRSPLAQLAKLAIANATEGHGILDLRDLKAAVDAHTDLFRGNLQQDAQEFLHWLLDGLYGEMTVRMQSYLKGEIGALSSGSSSSSSSPVIGDDIAAITAASGGRDAVLDSNSGSTSTSKKRPRDDEMTAGSSVIDLCSDDNDANPAVADSEETRRTDLHSGEVAAEAAMPAYLAAFIPTIRHFHAEVESTFTCKSCGFMREPKNEFYRIFSLNLGDDDVATAALSTTGPTNQPRQLRLVDLLGSFFAEEERELACDHCTAVGARATATSRMTSTPGVLIIHLKRSRFQRATTSYSKIRCPVQFPLSFRLDEEGGLVDVLHPEATHGGDERLDLSGSFAETAQLIRQAQTLALAEEEAMALEVANDDDEDVMEMEEGTTDDVAAMGTDDVDPHQGWSCHQCTLLNEAHHVVCLACDTARHDGHTSGGTDDENGMFLGDSPVVVDEEEPVVIMHQDEEREESGTGSSADAAAPESAAAVIDLTTLEESEGSSSQSQTNNQEHVQGAGYPPASTSKSTHAHALGDSDNASAATGGAGRWQYRLSAVVRHMGNNVFTGHYICDTYTATTAASRVGKALGPGGAWRRCDDSIVNPITEEDVLADKTSPYILFYERVRVV